MNNFIYFSVLIILFSSFFLGAYALEYYSVQYISAGGEAFYKIHFYSYFSFFIIIVFYFSAGLNGIQKYLGRFFFSWIFLVFSMLYTIVYGLLKHGTSGMAYIVDSLFVPIMLFPVLLYISKKRSFEILKLVCFFLVVNSLSAIFEYSVSYRLFDFEYEQTVSYFRSTAFFSHPLNNALISVCLVFFIAKFNLVNYWLMLLMVLLSLFCFGARAATAVFLLFSLFYTIEFYKEKYHLGYLSGLRVFLIVCSFLGFCLFVLYYAVTELGFGQRILENIAIDVSAQSRIELFDVFSYLSFNDYLFGVEQNFFNSLEYYIDNSVVENFVVGWFLFYGIVGSSLLIVSFFWFFRILFKEGDYFSKVSVLSFLLVSVTNNSLASKTPAFLFLIVTYAVCYNLTKKNAIN